MKGAHSMSTRRAYGVQRVCRCVAPRPLQRVCAAAPTTSPCRRGPVDAPPRTTSWLGHIGRLEASPFHGEAYGKPGRKLRVEIRTSQERVRRLMREHDLGPAPRGPRARPEGADGTIDHRGPRCDVGHGS